MFRRARPLRDPVTVHLDGAPVLAQRGEPVAAALLAQDMFMLARSPKLHRPRGPSCMRGACDGCLARVDGVPNVMTCLVPATDGVRVETQNFVGSRKADLLRITDWFFPDGIDHHHLLAGIPGVSDAVQSFARKLAGLGRLPSETETEHPAERLETDVLVVGGGLAGLIAASRIAAGGLRVCLVDDGLVLGGSVGGLEGVLSPAVASAAALAASQPLDGVTVFVRATAAGVYGGEVLVATAERATVVRPRAIVLATGAHDGVLAVPNNDLPGVLSARALFRLLAYGVVPDGPVVIAGDTFWAHELARALGEDAVIRTSAAELVSIRGTGHVRGVTLASEGGERRHDAAIVAFAALDAPAFELAEQAGAAVAMDPERGYRVVTEADGRAGETLWATGECTGMPFEPAAIADAAERAAASVLRALGARQDV